MASCSMPMLPRLQRVLHTRSSLRMVEGATGKFFLNLFYICSIDAEVTD